jgi:hypothetical protein
MFGWGELFLAFVVGMGVAVWVMAIFVRRWAERLRGLLEEALANETSTATTDAKIEITDKIVPLTVEVENNLYYCYNSNTNQFVCQGADVKEITDQFQQRFPGLNAFFNSGDEAALTILRQQLKDNRENSNSIRSAS